MSKLSDQQALFVENLGKLIAYAVGRGYRLRMADGAILQKGASGNGRRVLLSTGATAFVTDAVHRTHPPSAHYTGRGVDFNLDVKDANGEWVWKSSDCPEWQELGKFWEGLHPHCRWGGRFKDLNHFSFTDVPGEA